MPQTTTIEVSSLSENSPQPIYQSQDWNDVLILNADSAIGDLFVSTKQGVLSKQNAISCPYNQPIGPIPMAPGTILYGMSGSGTKTVAIIVAPQRLSKSALDGLETWLSLMLAQYGQVGEGCPVPVPRGMQPKKRAA